MQTELGIHNRLESCDPATKFVLSNWKKVIFSGIKIPDFGTGSTPSCSHFSEEMSKLTEIHPGNYIFYDLQQHLV